LQNLLFADSIQYLKNNSLHDNYTAINREGLNVNCIEEINFNKTNNNNHLLEISEQEYETEYLLREKRNKIKRDQIYENCEYSNGNSYCSSNSFNKLNNSNTNSLNSNNSKIFIDKNNINKIYTLKRNESKTRNLISNPNINNDNFNSNLTFNVVVSRPNIDNNNSSGIFQKNNKNNINKKSLDKNSIENISKKNFNSEEKSENEEVENFFYIKSCPKDDSDKNNNFVLNNYFTKKNFAFILFELNNFCFTQKEYFKNIYPEVNLVMVIEFNDCVVSQEKIFFYCSNDDNSNLIYLPFLNKEDLKFNRYRIIKPIEMNDEEFPIKISINFYTFINYKMLTIGNEEIFLTLKKDNEMQKFNFYYNVHLKFVNKKVGNTLFNIAYKIDEIYQNQLFEKIDKNLTILSVKNIFLFISIK